MVAGALEAGRAAFGRRAWAQAFAQLSAADQDSALEAADLELLATAAYLLGRDDDGAELLGRAHRERLDRSDPSGAARCAIWLTLQLGLRGEEIPAASWLARAHRLLEDPAHDCVEQGYLLIPDGLERIGHGDAEAARAAFGLAADIAERFGDRDLSSLARLGIGQTLIGTGETARAMGLLDDAMVAVTAGEVSPIITGIIYCAVIDACLSAFDLRRAQEWTTALTHWCASQPDLVPYRGQCLVHRAQLLQLHGAWPDAMGAALDASERLSEPGAQPAVGSAYYEQAELHRLRGEFVDAKEAYLRASRWIRDPQPGLALLLLARGQLDASRAAIQRAVDEANGPAERSRLLGACVEIMLAAGDVGAARAATDELRGTAALFGGPWLGAAAAQSDGAVLLAERQGRAALDVLHRAWTGWQELDVPYEAARTRVLLGLAHRGLGDGHSAEMEFDAARWAFLQLGARPDVARVEALSQGKGATRSPPLTARETQVLLLVATGKTNREVATELFVSEKTVAHHVGNIFTKLDLTSRAAATAYAYEHGLVRGS